jgi:hypothetical protein
MGLGSGIRKNLFRIPNPGVKKAPDPGSGSATPEFLGAGTYWSALIFRVCEGRRKCCLIGTVYFYSFPNFFQINNDDLRSRITSFSL